MRMRTRALLAFLPALCWLSAAARAADSTGHFTAMAVVDTRQGTRSLGFDIVITRPLSMEQAQPWKTALQDGGQQALLALLRQNASGTFQLGGLQYPINLIVAEPVSGGCAFVVVTARNFGYEETNQGQASLDFPFAAAAFMAPEFGTGDGTIYPKAALSVGDDGRVKVQPFEGRTGRLKDVKRR
jgi:hypothetical protein